MFIAGLESIQGQLFTTVVAIVTSSMFIAASLAPSAIV
ncbi:putative membrane protein [Blastomonas sp. RAC04]|jgi:hypothetical protein|nr:putative membrane protein [Blastomonas sp. RAC04]